MAVGMEHRQRQRNQPSLSHGKKLKVKKKELVYLYPIADWVSDLMPQISKICPFHAHLTSYIFVISYVYVVWEECLHYSDTKVALSLV